MLATAVFNNLAESRTNKFPFMGWRPLYASETKCAYRLIARLVQRSACLKGLRPGHATPVGALSISGRLSW
jgi:hypothetical protein